MCEYCEEIDENISDFTGAKHYKELEQVREYNSTCYHRRSHIWQSNNLSFLQTEYFEYQINYCPICGRKLTK